MTRIHDVINGTISLLCSSLCCFIVIPNSTADLNLTQLFLLADSNGQTTSEKDPTPRSCQGTSQGQASRSSSTLDLFPVLGLRRRRSSRGHRSGFSARLSNPFKIFLSLSTSFRGSFKALFSLSTRVSNSFTILVSTSSIANSFRVFSSLSSFLRPSALFFSTQAGSDHVIRR